MTVDWGWCYTMNSTTTVDHSDIFTTLFGNSTIPIPILEDHNTTIPSVSFPFIMSIEWNNTMLKYNKDIQYSKIRIY